MSTAIVIFTHEFQQIRQRRISPSLNLEELAARIRSLTNKVKREWDNLCDEDREEIRKFAYDLIESPAKGVLGWKQIRARINWWFIKATNQTEAFEDCIKALDVLVETILDAVERQNPSYQTVLSDTLEQLYSCPEQGEELKPEETRDWLRSLSDSAIGEV